MQNDQAANMSRERYQDGGLLTISGLLNIFYRGRLLIAGLTVCGVLAGIVYGIVTKPLYQATAQVRPGVVSFHPDGRPEREWALEDIVNWFSNDLYWEDFKETPEFSDMKSPPTIDAAFIPSLNFVAGGNVITLTNFATSPAKAVQTLNNAISIFNQQAVADSVGSTLFLTLRNGRFMMKKLRQDIELVNAKASRIRLEIGKEEREISMVDLKDRELELDRQVLEAKNTWMRETAAATLQDIEVARKRLTEAESVLEVVLGHEIELPDQTHISTPGSDPVSDVLKQTASRELAGRVAELLMTAHGLKNSISRRSTYADSLTAQVRANELEINRIDSQRAIEIAKDKADIEQKIQDLQITLDKDLPYEREILRNELETEQMKVDLVSPLERVGTVSVSDKPVRPRKLRATAILTILAFLGSLFAVLVREYFRNNREAIMAPRHPNA